MPLKAVDERSIIQRSYGLFKRENCLFDNMASLNERLLKSSYPVRSKKLTTET